MTILQRITDLETPIALTERNALVIGATAGIGKAVATQLAMAGANTIIAGRSAKKLESVRTKLSALAPNRVFVQQIDLCDLTSIRCAAEALCSAFPRLDIVIANASVKSRGRKRRFTRDGLEETIGVNHLGNAALLLALERPIRAAQGGRVVIVASEAHRRAHGLPLEDLMGEREFNGPRAYARSKLANILFAEELAEQWPETIIYATHPGIVYTGMIRSLVADNLLLRLIFPLVRPQILTPNEAARGVVRLAIDPDLREPSGTYFALGRPKKPSRLARNRKLRRALFHETLRLVGREHQSRASNSMGKNIRGKRL